MTGADYERELKQTLESRAWIVTRAAGSLGRGDLWAAWPPASPGNQPSLRIIECKSTRSQKIHLSRKPKLKRQYQELLSLSQLGFHVEYAAREVAHGPGKTWHLWTFPIEVKQKWPVLEIGEAERTLEAE